MIGPGATAGLVDEAHGAAYFNADAIVVHHAYMEALLPFAVSKVTLDLNCAVRKRPLD